MTSEIVFSTEFLSQTPLGGLMTLLFPRFRAGVWPDLGNLWSPYIIHCYNAFLTSQKIISDTE